jgi:hypothetical protein
MDFVKSPTKKSPEQANEKLLKPFGERSSRRTLLKGAAMAGAAGLTAAGAGAFLFPKTNAAHASGGEGPEDSIAQILSIAATAEQLAVTFYSNGIANAKKLGISGQNLSYLKAAVIEEQIHQQFLVSAGGSPLTGTFSFPYGAETFEDVTKFINTLNQLETAFEAAYLAAVNEFALYNQARLAQIAAQILAVEAEHRALGRSILPNLLANNWAFAPALVESVGDAVGVLSSEGYLSPTQGNSYQYQPVSTNDNNIVYRTPFVAGEDND